MKIQGSENGITEMSKNSRSVKFEVAHPLVAIQQLLQPETSVFYILGHVEWETFCIQGILPVVLLQLLRD
jgi:hypothetical protein